MPNTHLFVAKKFCQSHPFYFVSLSIQFTNKDNNQIIFYPVYGARHATNTADICSQREEARKAAHQEGLFGKAHQNEEICRRRIHRSAAGGYRLHQGA